MPLPRAFFFEIFRHAADISIFDYLITDLYNNAVIYCHISLFAIDYAAAIYCRFFFSSLFRFDFFFRVFFFHLD